jgi:hypothetical protein
MLGVDLLEADELTAISFDGALTEDSPQTCHTPQASRSGSSHVTS